MEKPMNFSGRQDDMNRQRYTIAHELKTKALLL